MKRDEAIFKENLMTFFITYTPKGRLGNNIFQYLTCKLLEILWKNHIYIDYFSISPNKGPIVQFTDEDFNALIAGKLDNTRFEEVNIMCDGFFQKSVQFVKHREMLLSLTQSDDCFIHKLSDYRGVVKENCNAQPFKTLFNTPSPYSFSSTDIIISLRLSDFIQYPCRTSDIVSPYFYINILKQLSYTKLYIVSDVLIHKWEKDYIALFNTFNPIYINGSILEDFATLRSAPRIIHSNSTFCWLASFFGNATERWIPRTHMYASQECLKISDTDMIYSVTPLLHEEALNIDIIVEKNRLHSLSYGIPDEIILSDVPEKTQLWADVIPGKQETYKYGPGQDQAYYDMYKRARFAITKKKGGWDCLRHYEILANGCIPVFENLEQCPTHTLNAFPKDLLAECTKVLLPWKDTPDHIELYNSYVTRLLSHTKAHLSCSALAQSFLTTMGLTSDAKVLFIRCDAGVNYFREMLFIGLNRLATCVSYPQIPYMYTDYPVEKTKTLHGCGYGYSRRLFRATDLERIADEIQYETYIKSGIEQHTWDAIVYAKMGLDELHDGTIPRSPLWNIVSNYYTNDKIAFLYGGDECHTLNDKTSRYIIHLKAHMALGHCFVRELDA